MIKLVVAGLWVLVVTLAASYAAATWKAGEAPHEKTEYLDGLNYEKTTLITVPMLADGALQGFIVAQFVFTADAKTLAKLSVPLHPFVVDEAFRQIYADPHLDFRHLESFDIEDLTARIAKGVNERVETELVVDVLVEQFNYMSTEDLRSQPG